MKDKYQYLVEDNNFVSTSSEINATSTLPAPSAAARRQKRLALGCMLAAVCVLTILCTCILSAFIIRQQWHDKYNQYHNYVQSSGGVTQYVTSSVEQNFVQYYIENQMNEKTWILDDFNVNLEIIKSETDDDVVCYVAELNYTEALPPGKIALNEKPAEKKQFHGIMSPDMYPVSDKSFLGSHGARLCGEGVEVYWLRPMDSELDINNFHQDLNMSSLPVASGGRSGRSKRNVRSCHTSCCWLVCCCDVYHFQWETVEHFTCKHVCTKCTKQYKPKIQQIC